MVATTSTEEEKSTSTTTFFRHQTIVSLFSHLAYTIEPLTKCDIITLSVNENNQSMFYYSYT